jgi:fibronectin-binding autotransporter adhesin
MKLPINTSLRVRLPALCRLLLILSSVALPRFADAATTFLWNVASPGANNWNVNANWIPATGNPGSTDTGVFGTVGTAANSTTVNNIVSVSTAITSLQYTNTTAAAWHVTQLADGVTLSTSGNVIVGSALLNAAQDSTTTSAAILGNGTFQASGNNFLIGYQGNSSLNSGTVLDLSGLTNFIYNASAGVIGMGISNRSTANFILAAGSNYITVGTINQDTGSSSSSGTAGALRLGAGTNVINVGTVNVAAGRTAGSINFFAGTGGLRLRGVAGGDNDRVATVVLGNRNTGSTSAGQTTGTLNFNGHPVDAKISTTTLGTISQTANTNLSGIGILQFDQGKVDISTVNMGVCGGNSATLNLTNGAIGTLTVGASGTLYLNSVSLANLTSTAVGSFASGTLNVFGGTAICTNNIVKTTTTTFSTGTVAIASSGVLYVQGRIGTPVAPIDNLNVTNGTLRVNVDASGAVGTNASVLNVNASGITTFDVAQVIGVSGPVTIPLVAYSTLNGTVAGNFAFTVPSGYIAALVDNSAQKRIDLSISPSVIIVPLVWTGATNGDWDLTTSNWVSAGLVNSYSDNSVIVFDDSASNSTVNLTGNFSPAKMTMSNSVLSYTFSGAGSIGGTNTLTVRGSQTTLLDNSGSNSYTGGTFISTGTLQIGNGDANGNLPGGTPVSDNASLVYRRSDNVTNDNTITGTGSLTQNGSATLTLAGANSHGVTVIGLGTLQVGAGGTSGTLGTGNVTNNTALVFNRSDNVTVNNSIFGPGSATKNNNNVLTLGGTASTYSGGLNVNSGTVRLSATNAAGSGTITVNAAGTAVLGVALTNPIVLSGGVLSSSASLNPLTSDLTASASTASTIAYYDPANPAAADPFEMAITGTLHGSGSILLVSVTNDPSADSGNGFRLRGTAPSDFSGTITLSNKVKGEIQTTVAGPFSPAGTGKFIVYGGVLTNNTVQGTFSELNLRNNGTGSTSFGNDIEVAGTGLAVLDPIGSAPTGSSVTMGNLKLGAGQEVGVNFNGTGTDINHPVIFNSVTLNGGNATFSPRTPGWNTAVQFGSDLTLGNITELTAGSGFTMNGQRILTLMGNSANVYSGPTTNANGTLALNKTSGNAIPGLLAITGGTVSLSAANQISDSSTVIISGGSLNLGSLSETVGPVILTSGSILGTGGLLRGSSYDLQSGSIDPGLAGAATLTKSSGGTVTLTGTNIYTGDTLVSAGSLRLSGNATISNSPNIIIAFNATLDVTGRPDQALTLTSGQTLSGNGTLNGRLVVDTGANVAPGASAGILTITNGATLLGTTTMELSASTNDLLVASNGVAYGGTLSLVFTPGTLSAGNTFKLFEASTYTGAFATLNPATPGANLLWDVSQLTVSGTLGVIPAVNTTPTNVVSSFSGNELTLSWPSDHTGWTLQTNSTDVTDTNAWHPLAGSSTTNEVIMTVDPAKQSVFYRLVYP